MLTQRALIAFALLVPVTAGFAQDSLCNPCVDPPPIRRDNFTSARMTTVLTARDMRNLGVISVADLVSRLSAYTSPRLDDCGQPITEAFGGEDWHVFACTYGAGQAALRIEPADPDAAVAPFVFLATGDGFTFMANGTEPSDASRELEKVSTGRLLELLERARAGSPK